MWEKIEALTIKQLLTVVAGFQLVIILGLFIVGSQAHEAIGWAKASAFGAISISGKADEISENFDGNGAVKCQTQ